MSDPLAAKASSSWRVFNSDTVNAACNFDRGLSS